MKIQPLNDLQKEINRLFVAGSRFAKGDPRLLKQVPVLDKLGEKSPVFKKLSQLLVELTEADTENTHVKLLDLSILLYSVLNTISDSVEASELTQIDTSIDNLEVETYLPYSKLNQLQGMFRCKIKYDQEYVKKSCDDFTLNDVRIHYDIANSINLTNIYMTSFVEDYISLKIPQQLFPYIYNDFDMKGAAKEAVKFRIINRISPDDGKKLIEDILNEGSTALKVEAIKVLGKDNKNEDILLAILKENKRDIIESALFELCSISSKIGIRKAVDMFKTKKYSYAVNALSVCNDSSIFDELLEELRLTYHCYINSDDDKVALNYMDKLGSSVSILENKNNDEKAFDFLYEVICNKILEKPAIKTSYAVQNAVNNIIMVIKNFDDEKYIETLANNKSLSKSYSNIWRMYFEKVCYIYDKAKIYDVFSDAFIKNILWTHDFSVYAKPEYKNKNINYYPFYLDTDKIDKRFIDLYLKTLLESKGNSNAYYIIHFLKSVISPTDTKEIDCLYKYFHDNKKKQKFSATARNLVELAKFLLIVNYKNIENELVENFIDAPVAYSHAIDLSDGILIDKLPKKYEETFRELHKKTNSRTYLEIADGLRDKK